jgi:molecular chaperone DnaK (HSP70)
MAAPSQIPNLEAELSTPSVFFDHDEASVGTEALRNAITRPQQVGPSSKRHTGDSDKRLLITGFRVYGTLRQQGRLLPVFRGRVFTGEFDGFFGDL